MLSTDLLLLLLLLSTSCFAQGLPGLPQPPLNVRNTCSVQSTTITCTCRPGVEMLDLTPSFMEGGGGAEELKISGCSSVTFGFPPLQNLRKLTVSDTARATFQEKASSRLRHLALSNVSQVALNGPIFQSTDLETLWLEQIHVKLLPRGAFANLRTIQNVTLTDAHFVEVEEGAIGFDMVSNSQLIIMNTELLGVQKSSIMVKGVAFFTMHNSSLTTVGDDGLQLDAKGPISFTNSRLQLGGSLNLAVPAGTTFTFNNNVWSGADVFQVAQKLLQSDVIFAASGNTFNCMCGPNTEKLVNSSVAKLLLDRNQCDEGLCGVPVPMNVLLSCGDKAALQAGCKSPPLDSFSTKAPAPPGVTQVPKSAKPPSPGTKNTATVITISVTTALLLTVPAAVALAL